jgi:hypothetical protein
MKGWKFLFLPDLTSPAELPPDMEAFKQQQYRWAKGGAQTCKKLLPMILKSKLPKRIKVEAFFHLTNCLVYVYVVLLTLMMFPVIYFRVHSDHALFDGWLRYLFDASVLLLATFGGGTFYISSQRALFRTWSEFLKYIPFLLAIGVGICLNNARAVIDGFFGKPSEFVRTPKFGVTARDDVRWKNDVAKKRHRRKRRVDLQPFVELAIGLYLTGCLMVCLVERQITVGTPFLCLFMVGYLYVPMMTWFGHRLGKTVSEVAGPDAAVVSVPSDHEE